MKADTIINSVTAVTKKWTKQRKAEERGRARSRRDALTRRYRRYIADVAAEVMPDAYWKTSGGGRYPAAARQIYYVARGPILQATGRSELGSQYFCQVILPNYLADHPDQTSGWDITYDARGHFCEPHTELIVPLGTLDVRLYLQQIRNHAVDPIDDHDFRSYASYPTCGPDHRFGAVLFIEKEGFKPLFKAAKLAERYDLAIMSTKGMPIVACRHLADMLCGPHDIPLLVLRDFDKAGFSIVGTLGNVDHWDPNTLVDRSKRYEYRHDFDVIDLGLRLADVQKYDLQSEPVGYRGSDPSRNLAENGATAEEIAFLYDGSYAVGQRVELNAFMSDQFVEWIEEKLREHKVKKVVPDTETLEVAYRRALQTALVHDRLPEIVEAARREADSAQIPKGLKRILHKRLCEEPIRAWDDVLRELAREASCKKRQKPEQ